MLSTRLASQRRLKCSINEQFRDAEDQIDLSVTTSSLDWKMRHPAVIQGPLSDITTTQTNTLVCTWVR